MVKCFDQTLCSENTLRLGLSYTIWVPRHRVHHLGVFWHFVGVGYSLCRASTKSEHCTATWISLYTEYIHSPYFDID